MIDNPLKPNGSEWAMDAEDILNENDLLTPDNREIIKQVKFFNGQGVGKTYVDQLVGILKRIIKNINKDTGCIMNNEAISMTREKVFIVYSHQNKNIMREIKEFIRDLKFEPKILDIAEFTGSIWDAFVKKSEECPKAVVIMSDDDLVIDSNGNEYKQARPNVFIELGYMIHKCGLKNVTIVYSTDCKEASDIKGLVSVHYGTDNWRESLRQQLNR